jgi:hypothetical protein
MIYLAFGCSCHVLDSKHFVSLCRANYYCMGGIHRSLEMKVTNRWRKMWCFRIPLTMEWPEAGDFVRGKRIFHLNVYSWFVISRTDFHGFGWIGRLTNVYPYPLYGDMTNLCWIYCINLHIFPVAELWCWFGRTTMSLDENIYPFFGVALFHIWLP